MQLILDNHIGMGFKMLDRGNAWFFRLQAIHCEDAGITRALSDSTEKSVSESETKNVGIPEAILKGGVTYEWLFGCV